MWCRQQLSTQFRQSRAGGGGRRVYVGSYSEINALKVRVLQLAEGMLAVCRLLVEFHCSLLSFNMLFCAAGERSFTARANCHQLSLNVSVKMESGKLTEQLALAERCISRYSEPQIRKINVALK